MQGFCKAFLHHWITGLDAMNNHGMAQCLHKLNQKTELSFRKLPVYTTVKFLTYTRTHMLTCGSIPFFKAANRKKHVNASHVLQTPCLQVEVSWLLLLLLFYSDQGSKVMNSFCSHWCRHHFDVSIFAPSTYCKIQVLLAVRISYLGNIK